VTMNRAFVIAINAVSGGGKTSLAKLLHESLPGSALFCFDEFEYEHLHSRFRDVIDLSIWVETPLDIAMARRILRDFLSPDSSVTDLRKELAEDLMHYVAKARQLYMDDRHRNSCDLVLDGAKPLDYLRDRILEAIPK